ncbi:MAG: maltose ABC transporter substrate-binding protein [Clostridiales bacterium]|nr:maltose ABC transporter substrate-binding protein [Clostridiales bacterium]
MRKKVLSVFMCAAMAMTMLAGCGGNGSSTGNGDTGAVGEDGLTTEEITLKVWESSGETEEFIKQAGEAFTELHPNITIEYENVEIGDANTQIALDGPGGVGADVFGTPSNTIGGLVAGGHILPLDNEDDVKGKVAASCESAVTYDGKIYGYPVSDETYALFYNKDLVKEVPKTWEEMEQFCKEFNSKGKYGVIWNVADAYYSPIFTGKNGNKLFGPEGTDASNTYMATEDAITGMEYFQSFRNYLDVPAADLSDNAVCLAAFTEGNAAMYITGPWNVASCEAAGMNFGVTTLPSLPGDDTPAASFSGARTMQISAYTEHPAEAQAFAKFLISDEMQQLRFKLTGAIPSVDIDVDSEYIKGFQEQLQYAYPTPSIKEVDNFWDPMKSACSNIWDGADVATEMKNCDQAILAN